jgi:hypothetical protein
MASSGNFCVWNAVTKNSYGTLSQGNLKLLGSSGSGGQRALSSFGLTSGKWYMEFRVIDAGNNYPRIGLSLGSAFDSANLSGDGYQAVFLFEAGSQNNGSNCKNANDSTGRGKFGTVSYTNTGVSGGSNIFGFALDLDNRKLFISKDGTYFNSGNPANGTNPQIAWTTTPSESIHLWGDAYQTATQIIANWGQDSTFSGNETAGGNADGNGHGDFHSNVPTGFLSLCSSNLPISDDIDPAQTDNDYPQKNFNVVTYTGNGSTINVTGAGFQPDFVWIKGRSVGYDNMMFDTNRGTNKILKSNSDAAEITTVSTALTSFDSDGFTYGSEASGNQSSATYVAWMWKCNGGTTVTNNDGSMTSTVQANTKAGFSIVTYTGDGSDGDVGHGLDKAPEFVMSKRRDGTGSWYTLHASAGVGYLELNSTGTFQSGSVPFGSSLPTASVVGATSANRITGQTFIYYCWHSVEGYSKFGKFEGNSNADGPFVYTGFRPRLVFCKAIDASENWQVRDTARSTYNADSQVRIYWNATSAEGLASTASPIDFLSNGFKVRGSNSEINSNTIVYGAWGDVSFKYNNTF